MPPLGGSARLVNDFCVTQQKQEGEENSTAGRTGTAWRRLVSGETRTRLINASPAWQEQKQQENKGGNNVKTTLNLIDKESVSIDKDANGRSVWLPEQRTWSWATWVPILPAETRSHSDPFSITDAAVATGEGGGASPGGLLKVREDWLVLM